MGRREQKERERKRAAAIFQSLEQYLPPRKKITVGNDGAAGSESVGTSSVVSATVTHLARETTPHPPGPATSEYRTGDDPESKSGQQKTGRGCNPVDIGDIFSQAKSSGEFCKAVQTLTAARKYNLLKNHKVPHEDHVFSTQYLGGCNRSFRRVWLSEHPWMVYSEQVDGVFCIACAIFCTRPSMGKFVTEPFRVWNKKSEKVKEHERCMYHQNALEQADYLKRSIEHPRTTIIAQVDARKAANIERNRAVLKSIASAVLFCGRQCIALRGVSEDLDSSSGNPGNFLALLKLLATHDDVLHSHLESFGVNIIDDPLLEGAEIFSVQVVPGPGGLPPQIQLDPVLTFVVIQDNDCKWPG